MKFTKLFAFALLSIFSILVLTNFASAAMILSAFTITAPTSVAHDAGSFPISFTLTNSGTAGTTDLTNAFTLGAGAVFLSSSSIAIADGTVTPTTASVTGTITFNSYQSGSFAGTITAKEGATILQTSAFAVPIASSSTFDVTSSGSALTVKNTGNTALSVVLTTAAQGVTFTPSTVSPSAGQSSNVNVLLTSTIVNPWVFGSNQVTITATPSSGSAKIAAYAIDKSFCSAGTVGTNLIIENVDLTTDGEDDTEWMPLDTVTVDVTVENKGTVNIEDVTVEIGLFDSAGVNVIGDVDFVGKGDEKVDRGRISDDSQEDASFEFKIPADFEDGSYKLAVKAFSENLLEINACDGDSSDMNKNFYQEISVERDEDNPIVVKDIVLSQSTASAGDEITAKFKVYNVGTNDEDQVRVNILSTALGINTYQEIRSDLNVGDSESLELTFTVPSAVKSGNAIITFSTDYDYDSGDEEPYGESSQDTWSVTLNVVGEPTEESLKVGVSAKLQSEAEAGEPLIVSATITNNEASKMTFVIDAKSFSDWAELDSISEKIITLDAGASKDIEFTFNVNKDASGENTFTVETLSGEKIAQKEVSVEIEGSSSLFSKLKGNSLIWIIGAINVILIALIIVIAVKLSK